ncbi:MAG TPA: glycosyltransferase family 1 protein [Xanthobacteraceae bacterium]|nr:glycosyltransferase family 1 protein [Xanthobacteraceae bacterium]
MKRTKGSPANVFRGPVLRYLYDLTTSAHWGGADVGILRVERQLARRARQHLGSGVEFCLYDRFRNLVLTIEDDLAAELTSGRMQIDFAPPPAPSIATLARRRVRRAVLANATLYQAFQRLRGRPFTREDILRIQMEELAPNGERKEPRSGPLRLADVPHRIANLDADTLLISGGLDWDFKDVRALATLKRQYKFRYCTIVYDIIAILYPHLVVPELSPVLTRYFSDLVGLADYAMCISERTRHDWTAFCRESQADAGPAYVFPLGADLPTLDTVAHVDFPEVLRGKRFALFVSTIEARKNHRMIYEAWDRCVRSRMIDPERDRLVFVGRRGWGVNDLMRELAANPATRDTLVVLNHVPDDLLRLLYQHCAFVVFPSLYEGYGLPLAEALAYGKPCISSDAGSLPEIGGDLVIRVDPKDTARWSNMIARYLRSPQELEGMTARIKAEFRPVAWDQAAAQFFSTIKDIGSSNASKPRL